MVFAPLNPVLAGCPLAVIFVCGPRRQIHVGHITEVFVLNLPAVEKTSIGSIFSIFAYLANCYKSTFLLPAATLILKLRFFKSRRFGDFMPALLFKQRHKPLQLYLDRILPLLAFNEIQERAMKKTAVCPDIDFPDPFGQPGKTFLHKFHTTIGSIGVAGAEPIMKAFSGFRDEAKQWMIASLPLFSGIIAFFRTLLMPPDSPDRRVHIQSHPAEPLFAPYLFAKLGLDIRKLFAVFLIKQFKNTPHCRIIGKLFPLEQRADHVIGADDGHMAQMFNTGDHAYYKHHNRIRYIILGCRPSFDANMFT